MQKVENNDHSPGCYGYNTWKRGPENMFMFLNNTGHEEAEEARVDMEARCEINRFSLTSYEL